MNKKIPISWLRNENVIKAGVINNYARRSRKAFAVCNELTFSSENKIADLVFCKDSVSVAIEIKSFNDDFRKLEYQLPMYCKVFDYVYVALTSNHLGRVDAIPDNVGVILFSDGGNISYERKAKRNSIEIGERLNSMPIRHIRAYLSNNKYSRKDNSSFGHKLVRKIFADYLHSVCRWTQDDLKSVLHYEDVGRNMSYVKLRLQ